MMSLETRSRSNFIAAAGIALAALFAALIAGCGPLRDVFAPSAPGVGEEWAARLEEVRAFERRIGFDPTDNFAAVAREQEAFPFCGHASRLMLPYSYQDPAIQWLESVTEQECQTLGRDADVYFGVVEVWGEVGTPVTPAMIDGKLDRFLYLVMHENCHDQFDFPFGVEEPLCNLITYKAMAAFTAEKFGRFALENRAVGRYADRQSRLTRSAIDYYNQLALLYARLERNEIGADALLQQRAAILFKAERALDWNRGELNNVGMANEMTYSRHYPFLESVHEALGRDLARTVEFFRHVDRVKPTAAAVRKQHRIVSEKSVDFIRAYETAVVDTIRNELAAWIAASGVARGRAK